MKPFNVYPLFDVEPARAQGSYIYDKTGQAYLDLYGGHAVISIGHRHPHYVNKLKAQLDEIAFYSNSVKMPLQDELSQRLGQLSGYPGYDLFLCNSGAEANENALKLASFHNGRKKIIAFSNSFHGRTSLAVAATNDASISAPINQNQHIQFLPFNDESALEECINDEVCAVIIEGIQGVGGIHVPSNAFLQKLQLLCEQYEVIVILDEVQSGYGRSGKFFAHQYAGISPHLVTVAKGMGNGFPVGGVLIAPKFEARHGMLGSTFGGNYLACAAAIAVLEVIEQENLLEHAASLGSYLMDELRQFADVKEVRGMGLMIGIEFDFPCANIRKQLLTEHFIFTGSSANKNTLRLLPALTLKKTEADLFLHAFKKVLTPQTIAI